MLNVMTLSTQFARFNSEKGERKMKKRSIAALMVIAGLILIVGIPLSRRVQAMKVQVNAKDFPEHGLKIIGPMDPAFNGMLAAHLKRKKGLSVDSLTPFSFFVRNTGDLDVVALMVTWDLTGPDGVTTTKEMGYANMLALMEGTNGNNNDVIKRNSNWFFAIGLPPESATGDDETEISTVGIGGSASEGNRPEIQEAARQSNHAALLKVLKEQLAQSTDITISIVGAFFEDGSFVGSEDSKLFTDIKAHVDARHDLLQEIALGKNRNMPSEAIFGHVKSVANNSASPRLDSTPADRYNFYKKLYAEELLRKRPIMGDDKAIGAALQQLRKPWPKLKKK